MTVTPTWQLLSHFSYKQDHVSYSNQAYMPYVKRHQLFVEAGPKLSKNIGFFFVITIFLTELFTETEWINIFILFGNQWKNTLIVFCHLGIVQCTCLLNYWLRSSLAFFFLSLTLCFCFMYCLYLTFPCVWYETQLLSFFFPNLCVWSIFL